jgi:hypothetical protein
VFYNADGTLPEVVITRDCFKYNKFLKHRDAAKPDYFLRALTETSLFAYFIEAVADKKTIDPQIEWFDDSLLKVRTNN